MKRFDAIYERGIAELQRKLDLAQLDADYWKMEMEENEIDCKSMTDDSNPDIFALTKRKWNEFAIKESEIERNRTECNGTEYCNAFQRLRFVLAMFKEHFLEQMVYRNADDDNDDQPSSSSEKAIYDHLFAECLSKYDAVALLNDFEHIRKHRAGTEKLRDCKVSAPLSVCCGELVTECRESEHENVRQIAMNDDTLKLQQFIDSLDSKQRVLIQITSRIHIFINHSIQREMEQELKDDEEVKGYDDSIWRRRRQTTRRKLNGSPQNSVSKFVNEMGGWKQSTDKTKMDDLPSILLRRHLSRSDTVSFIKYLETEHMDSDAVNEDLSAVLNRKKERELVLDSNLFPMLQNDVLNAKNVLFHFNELPPFRFGFSPFYHWKYYEQKRPSSFIKSPKYSNLKEECLENNIFRISRNVFARTLEMARTLWQIEKGRSLKAAD